MRMKIQRNWHEIKPTKNLKNYNLTLAYEALLL